MMRWGASLCLVLAACGGSGGAGGSAGSGGSGSGGGSGGHSGGGPVATLGDPHTGSYNLGPVDWSESQWHNACSPYPASVQKDESAGELLAGMDNSWAADGHLCDACLQVQTPAGKSVVVRVVTYGVSNAPNDLDLSPAAYDALTSNEYPRTMTWQLASCPDGGKIEYQFQTGANIWWTSLWVRDAKLPIQKVEVKSSKHADWFALERGSDGTLTDGGGFGDGSFTLRVTAVDGQTVSDTFPGFQPGQLITSSGQFN